MVMSPVGLGTKNHCAGEGQQQFSSQSVRQEIKGARCPQGPGRCDSANILVLKLRYNKRSASTERPTPPLVGDEVPFLKPVHV
jgi:hypothetical protein